MSSRESSKLFTMEKADKIRKLFNLLVDTEGIEIEYIRLTFCGKEYRHGNSSDAQSLDEIGIQDDSTIFMVSRLPGGH
uniref:Uncharacterized protein n=1 Tax=Magallana gigas TaxID=29159 RepID=K1Q8D9_MAGGI